jgi:hypothetical protein
LDSNKQQAQRQSLVCSFESQTYTKMAYEPFIRPIGKSGMFQFLIFAIDLVIDRQHLGSNFSFLLQKMLSSNMIISEKRQQFSAMVPLKFNFQANDSLDKQKRV